jgi:hypothetical protein
MGMLTRRARAIKNRHRGRGVDWGAIIGVELREGAVEKQNRESIGPPETGCLHSGCRPGILDRPPT